MPRKKKPDQQALFQQLQVIAAFGVVAVMAVATLAKMYGELQGISVTVPSEVYSLASLALALLFGLGAYARAQGGTAEPPNAPAEPPDAPARYDLTLLERSVFQPSRRNDARSDSKSARSG